MPLVKSPCEISLLAWDRRWEPEHPASERKGQNERAYRRRRKCVDQGQNALMPLGFERVSVGKSDHDATEIAAWKNA